MAVCALFISCNRIEMVFLKTLSVFTPVLSFNVLIFEIYFAVSFINLSGVLVLKQTVNSSFFLNHKTIFYSKQLYFKILKDSEDYTNEYFDDLLNRVVHSEVCSTPFYIPLGIQGCQLMKNTHSSQR